MLEVKDLRVRVKETEILRGVELEVKAGEIHALMGPNGSGKTTLAYTIMGREGYVVTSGDILFEGKSILGLSTDERSKSGIFLALQEPPQIPGVRVSPFLVTVLNKRMGRTDLSKPLPPQIMKEVYESLSKVGLSREHLGREVNLGFSGGEKKRSELLQSLLLRPKLVILDEPDSGLDADGVKSVAKIIEAFRKEGKGVLLITHYARLLKHVKPDVVTVLYKGEIVAGGGSELADKIENEGYKFLNGGSEDEHQYKERS